MPDQKRNPLIDMLVELLATPQGQRVASDYKTVQDAAGAAGEYMNEAPNRAYAQITDRKTPEGPLETIQSLGDIALTVAPVVGGVKTLAGAAVKGWPGWAAAKPGEFLYETAIGPKLAKEAGNYTEAHREAAKEAMRRILADPNQNLSRQTLKEGYQAAVKRKRINVGPQGDQLDDMAKETLRRFDDKVDLPNPNKVETAIRLATGYKKAGKPVTFGAAGMVGADQMSDPELEALLAEIMGGGR